MDAAISGSTMRLEICTRLSVATASVMEWAMVKQVMIFTEDEKFFVTSSRPKRKSRWSYPVQMCLTPITKKFANDVVFDSAAGFVSTASICTVIESEFALKMRS